MYPVGHRAGWIMLGPGRWIADGIVEISGDRIERVEKAGKTREAGSVIDHGPGVIMPSLVNAHTHLTLSHLSGKVDLNGGFLEWIMSMMEARERLGRDNGRGAAAAACSGLKESGVGLIGEFGSYFPIWEMMAGDGLWGNVWLEFFGNRHNLPMLPEKAGEITFAYAAHAPNTVSPDLLMHIKAENQKIGSRFCIHLAESEEESSFLATGKGPWADFLSKIGMDFSSWNCWGRSPVEHAHILGLLDGQTVAVHLLQVTKEEIRLLAEKEVSVCLCPRSNLNLHGRIPDINAFLAGGVRPALGTDSLASVENLGIFDEMRFVCRHFPGISPDTILGMGTVNGARALGRDDLGTIGPGKRGRLIYVELEAGSSSEAAEILTHGPIDRIDWL